MSATVRARSAVKHRLPASLIVLTALLSLLTVGAVQGGWAMISDPLEPLGMPTSYLEGTPIDTYTLPGIFFLAIAAASLLTAVGLMTGWRWGWAGAIERGVGYRWPWIGAVATGSILLVFEVVELFLVPFHPVMHPLLIAGSSAIVGIPLTRGARAALRA